MNGDQPTLPNPEPTAAPPAGAGDQKTAVVDKIRNASSILVAISANPSIDQLASALGLTLLLEKHKKNATAVFSGKIPSALKFLKPGETFEKNTDSLRDFIIAIDKSKADKLRYKVEDNFVKIFITPYKTSITPKDLQYNAGDFNVDLVVALGVHHQADLDTAITAHGRIFHDAVVVSINNVPGADIGVANWEEPVTSSLSELISRLAVELGPDSLDPDIATALLTGIVAETSRFSNEKTHPETMSASSQLLQAGADQKLVNQQLESVISNDVKLQAGAEIKPTMSAEELAEEFPHQEEELIIADDGTLKPTDVAEESAPETPVETPAAPIETRGVEPEAGAPLAEPALETDLDLESESEIEPAAEPEMGPDKKDGMSFELPASDPGIDAESEPLAPEPVDDPQETDAARQAVSDALKLAAAESEVITAIDVVEAPVQSPADAPVETASEPMPPAAPDVPAIGTEPAPLAMSPADQAFTMPMPPTSSITQGPPVAMAPGNPAPGAPATPPPLPPPIMPPVPQ